MIVERIIDTEDTADIIEEEINNNLMNNVSREGNFIEANIEDPVDLEDYIYDDPS